MIYQWLVIPVLATLYVIGRAINTPRKLRLHAERENAKLARRYGQ